MEWFENKEFWVELYPFLFSERRLQYAEKEVELILSLVQNRVHSVLDLCCGPGRHSVALAKRGFQVTGIDITASYLDKAKERAAREGVEVEWVLEDMRSHLRRGAYDLVLSLFTSFGYFESEEDNLRVLQNVHKSLRASGTLVMDLVSKEWLTNDFKESMSYRAADWSVLVQRPRISDQTRRVQNEWIITKDGKTKSFAFSHAIYSGMELRAHLLNAGFQSIRLYGDLEGNKYGCGSKRLVALATR